MKILGAALGDCVHIQGVYRFLEKAKGQGHETQFMGPAVSVERVVEAIEKERPDAVALSYRLTPENAEPLLNQLELEVDSRGLFDIDFLFGGTEPVVEIAKKSPFWTLTTDGTDPSVVESYLNKGYDKNRIKEVPPQRVTDRIQWKKRPLLRTHFGQPSIDSTIWGIHKIADSGLIDVISLGTDQDAQSNFFHPERQNPDAIGAGGVPARSAEDFRRLYSATRRGNNPLMRTYAGTDDLVQLAEMYESEFGNAWSAVPVFWFNDMDGRGPHKLEHSIDEHIKLMRWNSNNNIPVEVLESHHWAMRWAHDTMVVATAVLGAEIAKGCGVKDYIQQYMFNVPPQSSFTNELAKMLAIKEMICELRDDSFQIYHQTRTGLPSFPHDLEEARAQLASSTMLQMQLYPDIVHVVNYSEPHHAATADDVIASAKIVDHVITNSLSSPQMDTDPVVAARRDDLIDEAEFLVSSIKDNGDIRDPAYLSSLVTRGILDAPMLAGNAYAKGKVRTGFMDGKCLAVNSTGRSIREEERLAGLGLYNKSRAGGI